MYLALLYLNESNFHNIACLLWYQSEFTELFLSLDIGFSTQYSKIALRHHGSGYAFQSIPELSFSIYL